MRLRRELRGLRLVIGRFKPSPPTPQEERRYMSALASFPGA